MIVAGNVVVNDFVVTIVFFSSVGVVVDFVVDFVVVFVIVAVDVVVVLESFSNEVITFSFMTESLGQVFHLLV